MSNLPPRPNSQPNNGFDHQQPRQNGTPPQNAYPNQPHQGGWQQPTQGNDVPQPPQGTWVPEQPQQGGYGTNLPPQPPQQGGYGAPQPPKKKRNPLLIWVIVALGIVCLVGAALVAGMVFSMTSNDKPSTPVSTSDPEVTGETGDEGTTENPNTAPGYERNSTLPEENKFIINTHTSPSTGGILDIYAPNMYEEWATYSESVTQTENGITDTLSIALVKVNDETCRVQSIIFENPAESPVTDTLVKATMAGFTTDQPVPFTPYSENVTAESYLYPNVTLSDNDGVAVTTWFEEQPLIYTVTIVYCEEPENREFLQDALADPASDYAISYRFKE